MAAGPGWGEAGAADQAGGAAEGRATGRRQNAGQGAPYPPEEAVDTETEHEHFMHRVEGGRVWLSFGKRLMDSGVHLAARAVSLATSSGLQLVIFSFKFTSHILVFFSKN